MHKANKAIATKKAKPALAGLKQTHKKSTKNHAQLHQAKSKKSMLDALEENLAADDTMAPVHSSAS
eukprot:CAMPEP_0170488402 /NCGR_PEP_ID=MMETSP0208-20121228/6961_1 /TAXON_ID=197538 /ORGANISM="Strombidium inclinatum, Strain S3" /LENGTH=65 /DNA_ID=CAMNT_0010762951 /DNA_START=36 /DNA_END=229 /DNA_ORIENTATION=+